MSFTMKSHPPSNPMVGDMWMSSSGVCYVFDGRNWMVVPPLTTKGPMRWALYVVDKAHKPYRASLASPELISRDTFQGIVQFCRENFGPTPFRWVVDHEHLTGGYSEIVFSFENEQDRLFFYLRFSDDEVR